MCDLTLILIPRDKQAYVRTYFEINSLFISLFIFHYLTVVKGEKRERGGRREKKKSKSYRTSRPRELLFFILSPYTATPPCLSAIPRGGGENEPRMCPVVGVAVREEESREGDQSLRSLRGAGGARCPGGEVVADSASRR